MTTLSPAERRAKRAAAHSLHPVVAIGHHGLTPAVLHEIDVALLAHELIKIRVFSDDRDARERMLSRVCAELLCAPVQHIGKLLVVWRPHPDKHKAASAAATATAARARKATGRRAGGAPAASGAAPRLGRGATSGSARATRRQREADAVPATPPRGDQSRKRVRAALPEAPRAPQSRRRRRAVKT